jgi:aromatic ring-opening dioxygenase catalytic subunit (LigB family)
VSSGGIELPKGEKIRSLEEEEEYRYLGEGSISHSFVEQELSNGPNWNYRRWIERLGNCRRHTIVCIQI